MLTTLERPAATRESEPQVFEQPKTGRLGEESLKRLGETEFLHRYPLSTLARAIRRGSAEKSLRLIQCQKCGNEFDARCYSRCQECAQNHPGEPTQLKETSQAGDSGAQLGQTLLAEFGTRLPKPVETGLACGSYGDNKDGRDGIHAALFDAVDSTDVTSVKLDNEIDADFQAAPLRIAFVKMFGRDEVEVICYLKSCEWRGRRVRLGYEVEVLC